MHLTKRKNMSGWFLTETYDDLIELECIFCDSEEGRMFEESYSVIINNDFDIPKQYAERLFNMNIIDRIFIIIYEDYVPWLQKV